MTISTCCTAEELQRLLTNHCTQQEESKWFVHLESCEACQRALEAAAGDAEWWREVESHLSSWVHERWNTQGFAASPAHAASAASAHNGEGVGEKSTQGMGEAPIPSEATRRQLLAMLAPSDDPSMMGRLGSYEVRGIIGRGGAGMVLKALDRTLNRYVAIKVLLPHWADNPSARERFAREGRAAAAVAHEHVTPIYAVDEFRGLPFLVMKYVTGGSLEQRLKKSGRLSVKQSLRIAMQTAQALSAAHEQGLVHRDVKPANILLEPGVERVLVTDFGLARSAQDATLTCSGFVAGTPKYMSPEQARGEAIDGRSDLFGLGCVLYELCAGSPPFDGDNLMGVLHQVCEKPHQPLQAIDPATPAWLSQLVDKLLAKSRDHRFASAKEAADVIAAELAHLQNPRGVPKPKRLYMKTGGGIANLFPNALESKESTWMLATCALLALSCLVIVLPQFLHSTSGEHEMAGARTNASQAAAAHAEGEREANERNLVSGPLPSPVRSEAGDRVVLLPESEMDRVLKELDSQVEQLAKGWVQASASHDWPLNTLHQLHAEMDFVQKQLEWESGADPDSLKRSK